MLPGTENTDIKALFSSAYAGSVRYYATMLRYGNVAIDKCEPMDNRSWIHNHCRIIGANGVQTLAIPIEKPSTWHKCTMRDIRISEHGHWRHIHWGALFSAYGKTPFFEYIAPDLQAIYERGDHWLIDFNMSLHELIVDFLDLPITTATTEQEHSSHNGDFADFRRRVGDKTSEVENCSTETEYYQIWGLKHGFSPNLSIFDLMMNTGREAIFTLMKMY